MPEHLGLECGTACADLLAARFTAARRVLRVVRVQPGLLGRRVNVKKEHLVEQVEQFILVTGNATDEHRLVRAGQDLLQPVTAPHPAMLISPTRGYR